MGGGRSDDWNSSGDEDGDAEWRAAISSVSNTSFNSSSVLNGNGVGASVVHSSLNFEEDEERKYEPKKLKHYQIKMQKLLDEMLEKKLEIVKPPMNDMKDDVVENHVENSGGIRLFKNAPLGVVFDHIDELKGPTKRPNLLQKEEIDEKSQKFKRKLQSVAVDGSDIITAANNAYQKEKARLEAKDMKIKEADRKEEARVAELKKIRGEKWLSSMAREMQLAKMNMSRK